MRIPAAPLIVAFALCACNGQASLPGANGGPSLVRAPERQSESAGVTGRRLFISDAGTGELYLYDVPSLKLFTILQGFARPQGECADNKGDVWVTDGEAAEIYELDYQGRTTKSVSDTTGFPDGCAWDPKTGNLAVFNYLGTQSKAGAVLVYHRGFGTPNTYTNPNQFFYDFGGYDAAGNLFFDGANTQGKFMLSELPLNATSARTIAVSGDKIYSAGMVQWDAASNYLDVGDQKCANGSSSCLYQMEVSRKRATIKNKITLENHTGTQVCDLVEGVISHGELFGSDNDYCGSAPSATYGWSYPSGGNPKNYRGGNDSMPIGAAIAVNDTQVTSAGNAPRMDLKDKKLDLLYVADGDGKVAVYTYWQKALVSELTGFSQPEGECVDKNNDIYITDAGKEDIVEYAHAGRKPLRIIDDSPYVPYGCAVDFTTGNLAVANNSGGPSGAGNIAIYGKASGPPTLFADAAIGDFTECVYDSQGNLLAANGGSGTAYFAWLSRGSQRLENILIPGPEKGWTWEDVQGLQWDGRYFVLDVDDLFRISIQNGLAYYVGETDVSERNVWGPYWIYNSNPKEQGTQFVGASHYADYPTVEYFNYPRGGDDIGYVSKDISSPNGLAISLGKIHE